MVIPVNPWSAEEGAKFESWAEQSFSWRYIDEPALRSLAREFITDKTVALDVGCGGGRVIRMLRKLGIPEGALFALDQNPASLDIARRLFPNITLFQHDLKDTPYPAPIKDIDLVTAHQVLQYLTVAEIRNCLAELRHLLKPAGNLLIGLPHPARVANQAGVSYFTRERNLISAPWGGLTSSSGLTVSDYVNLVISAGFHLLRIDEPEITRDGLLDVRALAYSPGPTRLMILAEASK